MSSCNPDRNDYDRDTYSYDEESDTIYRNDGDGPRYTGNGDVIDT